MGLVDHEQARALGDGRQDLGAEPRVVEPLGRDEQQVDVIALDGLADLLPVVTVLAVDRAGAHAGPLGHLDLVAHQREQRRDQDRRPGARVAEQPRGDEVHGRLPPAALDEEDPAALLDDGLDRLSLALAEGGIRPGDGTQQLKGLLGHALTLLAACDTSAPRYAASASWGKEPVLRALPIRWRPNRQRCPCTRVELFRSRRQTSA